MADLKRNLPLDGLSDAVSGDANSDITLSDIRGNAIVQVMARKGQADAVAAKLGIGMTAGRVSSVDGMVALALSPGQWLMISDEGRDGDLARQLTDKLSGIGYCSDQSHARSIISLSGKGARRLLAKGCRLDLHESASGAGSCAQTQIAQIGTLVHQVDDAPTYHLIVYSGFARSMWHWLEHSSAEFSLRIAAT